MAERKVRYDRSPQSLFFPGRANDFFPLGGNVSEAALCVEMARVAYIKHEAGADETDRLSRFLQRVGFTIVDPLDSAGTQGFIADGPSRDRGPVRVIAFRGTEPDDWRDLISDVGAFPTAWPGGGKVHRGFARALERVQRRVTAAIETATIPVIVTGHSLGAALATLVASLHPTTRLYTIGSPRVGNAEFAGLIQPERHSRYVDFIDTVTRMPPRLAGLLGYVHTGSAHFIDEEGDVHPGVSEDDVGGRQSAAGHRDITLGSLVQIFTTRRVEETGGIPWRELTDHAPINYVAAVMRLRP